MTTTRSSRWGSTPARAEALLATSCSATILNAGNELRAEREGCSRVGVVSDIGPYLGTVVAALETEDDDVRETRERFIDVMLITCARIVAGERSDFVVAAAKELLRTRRRTGAPAPRLPA